MKKIVKRISIMFICALLLFGTAKRAEAAAEAGALSILGGSVAAGGIGATLVAIAPPVAIIVGLALAAQGIYVAISEASEEAGMTKSDYIGTKLAQWALASGKSYETICDDIASNTSVTADGKFILTETASNTIYQFVNSLVANNDINEPIVINTEYIDIGGVLAPMILQTPKLDLYVDANGNTISVNNGYGPCVATTTDNENYTLHYICQSKYMTLYQYRNGSNYESSVLQNFNVPRYNQVYMYTGNPTSFMYVSNPQQLFVPVVENLEAKVLTMSNDFTTIQGEADQEGFLKDGSVSVDTSIYNPSAGESLVIDPGIGLDTLADSYGKTGVITIDNYLQSLQRALDGVQDNTIAISDTLTGVLENVAVGTYNPVGSATADQVAEEDLPRVLTPVIDATLNPTGSAAENALKGLSFDLTSIFPFCIPFDIFALIEKFDVQPETPRILVSLPLPGLDETLDLDLDLSPFETVAVILRSMELIAFIVGLALVTRNLIRG